MAENKELTTTKRRRTMPGPSAQERSTIISRYLDQKTWRVYTEDPVLIRKLEGFGFVAVETHPYAKKFEIPIAAISFRKGKRASTRVWSEEEKAKVRERFAKRGAKTGLRLG